MGAKGTNKGKASTERSGLGRTIIKQRFGGAARRREEPTSFLHTTEMDDGANWAKYQSITEQNDLDAFLATAELAGTEFIAERTNIKVVTTVSAETKLQLQYRKEMFDAMESKKHLLTVPRRPAWTNKMPAEELQMRERETFLDWRRQLSELQQDERLIMTPFERNLEVWRQLWRVIERSDLVVQIVDARNPILFRSLDLEAYIKQIDPRKENLLVINKSDMLTTEQRSAWAQYFRKEGVRFVFFSAEFGKHELEARRLLSTEMANESSDSSDGEDNPKISFYDDVSRLNLKDRQHINIMSILGTLNEDNSVSSNPIESEVNHHESINGIDGNENISSSDSESSSSETAVSQDEDDNRPRRTNVASSEAMDVNDDLAHIHSMNRNDAVHTVNGELDTRILGREDLLALFRQYSIIPGKKMDLRSDPTTHQRLIIGMVGYPNVGKSSTINVLVGEKRVAVASTPGKTKHFQTINIEEDICLCDCPGLVFPSFAASKAEMVLNGILPIDQLRDHISPATVLCQRFPRSLLESTYGVTIMLPGVDEDSKRSPTAYEFLSAVAFMRGFMKSGFGTPDDSRAARIVLKDYVDGKLLYCHPPPKSGLDDQQFNERQFQSRLSYLAMKRAKNKGIDEQIAEGKRASHVGNAQLPDKNAAILTGLPTFHEVTGPRHNPTYVNELDESFFNGKDVKAKAAGKVPLAMMQGTSNMGAAMGKKHFKNLKRQK